MKLLTQQKKSKATRRLLFGHDGSFPAVTAPLSLVVVFIAM